MKHLKTAVTAAAVGLTLCLCMLGASAKNGDVIGSIYSTDIKAIVNGYELESYNIGGKTAIVLEELSRLGAGVSYNDALRTLVIDFRNLYEDASVAGSPVPEYDTVGVPVGNIYESDIKTYLNGHELVTFSLGGRMAASVEDIVNAAMNGKPFSRYGAVCKWNQDARTVSLDFLVTDVKKEIEFYEAAKKKNYTLIQPLYERYELVGKYTTGIRFSYDEYQRAFYNLTDYSPCSAKVDGKTYNIGYVKVPTKSVEFYVEYNPDTPTITSNEGYTTVIDYGALLEILEELPEYHPTRDDIVKYYTSPECFFGIVHDRIDIDECTFLFLSQATPHGQNMLLLRIDNLGNTTNYADLFESVSLYGTKTFDNVVIDSEEKTVTFGYDKYYSIDLVTGEMKPLQ